MEQQFNQVIKAHAQIIYKVTTIYTRNAQDQQDLYQEVVLQLWRSFAKFRGEAKISTWVYRVALNTAISGLRKKKKLLNVVSIDQAVFAQTESVDPIFEERLRMLYQSIDGLSSLEKGLILLFLEDRNYEEIAEIIGISVSNVGTRLSRIRQKLKTKVKAAHE